jgi:hypothetical protein
MRIPLPVLSALLSLAFVGCTVPRVEVGSNATMLGANRSESRIPIRSFTLEGTDQAFETTSDIRFLSGVSRVVLFPKQAREFISQDLRDYVKSRFQIDPEAKESLTLNLEQAHSYFTTKHSGANWIPYVGVVTSIADGFQQAPVTFVVEVKGRVSTPTGASTDISSFIRQTEEVTVFSATQEKQREIFRREIDLVRKQLFNRLDDQLLTLWSDRRFVGKRSFSSRSDAAAFASQIAELDTALADGKISAPEHEKLMAALRRTTATSSSISTELPAAPETPIQLTPTAPADKSRSLPHPATEAVTKKSKQEPNIPASEAKSMPAPIADSAPVTTDQNHIVAKPALPVSLESKLTSAAVQPTKDDAAIVRGPTFGLKVASLSNEVYVRSVEKNSAAAKAGVQAGDKIVSLNGDKVGEGSFELMMRINTAKLGAAVEIVWTKSDGSERTSKKLIWP